jgi:hypothetical protein
VPSIYLISHAPAIPRAKGRWPHWRAISLAAAGGRAPAGMPAAAITMEIAFSSEGVDTSTHAEFVSSPRTRVEIMTRLSVLVSMKFSSRSCSASLRVVAAGRPSVTRRQHTTFHRHATYQRSSRHSKIFLSRMPRRSSSCRSASDVSGFMSSPVSCCIAEV